MEDIESLLEKYYAGDTTLADEKTLRDYFNQPTIAAHLQSHAPQFRMLIERRQEKSSPTPETWLSEPIEHTKPTLVRRLHWGWQVAASVTLLLLGFAGGMRYQNLSQPAEIKSVATQTEAAEVKRVLQFDAVRYTSASDRIQAVNQSLSLNRVDRDITQTLINTMNFDDNVNVRLAACQALYRFRNEPGVREAFIQSLKIQSDPMLQIALIDMLVEIKEKRAVEEMRRLVDDTKVLKVVRLKAEQGIGNLI